MATKNAGALADQAYRQIRRMILTNELGAGERLSQRGLAKQLGVSAMPVIEALRRLEQDGLVQRMHELGAFVKEWTAADIEEAFIIRRGLETEAARAMTRFCTDAEKSTLQELSDLIDSAIERGDHGGMVESELAFHLHLAHCARMQRLYEVLETTHAVVRSLYQWKGRADGIVLGIGDHRLIADAIAAGDPDKAAALVFDHITVPLERFREFQKNQSPSTGFGSSSAPFRMNGPANGSSTNSAIGIARELLA